MEAETATTEAPAETGQDQPVETTPAPEATSVTDQPTEEATPTPEATEPTEEESFSPFKLADVPEEHREYVEKAYKQLQGDYTRKTQEIADLRNQAQSAMALADSLQSPEGQMQVFRELAAHLGYDLQDDGNDVEEPQGPQLNDDDLADAPEWAQALVAQNRELQARLDARDEAEQTAAQTRAEREAEQQLDGHIDEQLAAIDTELTDSGGQPLPDEYKDAIVSHALASFPPGEDNMPQIRAAYDALEAEWARREKQWAASKDTPAVHPGGTSASQVPTLDKHTDRVNWIVEQMNQSRSG